MSTAPLSRLAFSAAALCVVACHPGVGNVANSTDESNMTTNASMLPAPPASEQRNAADGDPLIPETSFNAMGTVSCITRAGRAPRDCTAGVVRNRDGSTVVTIFWPEGRSRAISFDAHRQPIGVDTAEADGSAAQAFAARRGANSTIVTLGPERYEIPDIMVQGD